MLKYDCNTYKIQKRRDIVKKRYVAFILMLVLLFSAISCSNDERADSVLHNDQYAFRYSNECLKPEISSPQAFVYDTNNKTVLFTKGEDKVVYPGSTVKLITILYAMTVLSLDTVITAGDELDMVKPGSSIAYVKKGHRLTVEMLIEGMLLPSGNDAAYVLAAAVGREISHQKDINAEKAIDCFLNGVNTYIAHIGLCGTNITSPDGYAGEEQYTTTEDMIIICGLALENEIISKYASIYSDFVVYASGHTNTWTNTNLLLDPDSKYFNSSVTGLKTGSIMGEYSLVFTFKYNDGREYIAGVFGSDNKNTRFEDANYIISYFEECVLS
jgi:D-alanyl-D-alanine carboxypeptidase (penicillin-binding protein 5/6)